MTPLLALLLSFSAVADQALPPAAPARPFATFSVISPPGSIGLRIEIGLLEPVSGQRRGYWFREVGRRVHRVASTRSCPDAWAAVDRMEMIAMPWIDVPEAGHPSGTSVSDGAHYLLEAPALHPSGMAGGLRLESNVGTPLAEWVEAMLETLETCWRAPS